MNKATGKLFIPLTLFTIHCFFLICCSKSNSSSPKAASKFTWTYDGVNYIAKQDTAHIYDLLGPTIVAGLEESVHAPGSGPRITLSSFSAGTYSFGSSSTNHFRFVDTAGYEFDGTAGSLTIIYNVDAVLGGNFSVDLANGKKITGEFSNTPVKD